MIFADRTSKPQPIPAYKPHLTWQDGASIRPIGARTRATDGDEVRAELTAMVGFIDGPRLAKYMGGRHRTTLRDMIRRGVLPAASINPGCKGQLWRIAMLADKLGQTPKERAEIREELARCMTERAG